MVYFIRAKIIEIGSLQFQYEFASIVKIHIPKNTDLDIWKVKESIKKSKIEIKYICNSWLLSEQINEISDKNSNISKFYDLFDITEGEECINDILNFIYSLDKCEDYSLLSTNTTLQKKVKNYLLKGKKFYLGLGVLNMKKIYL